MHIFYNLQQLIKIEDNPEKHNERYVYISEHKNVFGKTVKAYWKSYPCFPSHLGMERISEKDIKERIGKYHFIRDNKVFKYANAKLIFTNNYMWTYHCTLPEEVPEYITSVLEKKKNNEILEANSHD